MKAILLPKVSDKMTVGDAVKRLIATRGATNATTVLTTRANKPAILNAKDLIRLAKADPKRSVAEVAVSKKGMRLSSMGPVIALDRHSVLIEPMFDKAGVIFGIVPGGGRALAHVITKTEGHASLFTGAWKICQCTGPGQHIILAGKVKASRRCNICGHSMNCG